MMKPTALKIIERHIYISVRRWQIYASIDGYIGKEINSISIDSLLRLTY